MGLVCWENVPGTRVLMAEILDQSNEVYFIDITRFKTSWMFLFPDIFYQHVLLELIGLLSRPCLLGRLSPTNWELISATKEQVQKWKLPTFISRGAKFRTGHQLILNWWLIGHLLVRRSVPYLQCSAIKEAMLPCRIGMWRPPSMCFFFWDTSPSILDESHVDKRYLYPISLYIYTSPTSSHCVLLHAVSVGSALSNMECILYMCLIFVYLFTSICIIYLNHFLSFFINWCKLMHSSYIIIPVPCFFFLRYTVPSYIIVSCWWFLRPFSYDFSGMA